MVVRWTFEDPVTLEEYEFDINPNAGGTPAYEKSFEYERTSAPDGKVIVFEGRDAPQKLEFSGVILEQAHYDAFVEWWQKRYQISVTDDLGRTFSIILEKFNPTRVRAYHYPWKHNYTVTATIVDWV